MRCAFAGPPSCPHVADEGPRQNALSDQVGPSADPWTMSWNESHETSGCDKDDLPKTGGAGPFYSFAAD